MIAGLLEFGLRWLLCCAGLFLLLGMLPLASRPAASRLPGGSALVIADLVLLPLLAALALWRGLVAAPWPGIVVIAGLLLLSGPFLVQPLPHGWRDGRPGLALLLVLLLIALVS
ncbi:MAG: hypothetical protein JWM77_2230 [Rhodospirillales bacterium]|nr:hypothetical protein [Rhodospirillales bacterium]